ncbi:hypothetical protein OWV82_008133 [Melia azedarach]|uniref:Uncharacterized protein n=1 Tax=Melia azedarach TaxID=155640 RepID=A0ACC1YAU5_MELAZ|nr:hypothetical protein OWV82_008133 [Melia azedarach]
MAKKRSVFVIQQVSAKSMPPMNMKLQRLWNPNSLRPKDSSSDFGNGPPFRISNKFHRRFFSKLETHLSECYDRYSVSVLCSELLGLGIE